MAEMGLGSLPYLLQRITTFIESDTNKLLFPSTSVEVADVLIKFVRKTDATFLLSDQYNGYVKMAAAKLMAAIEANKCVKLTHDFVDCEYGKNCLIYTKTMESEIVPPKPLRTPKELRPPAGVEQPADDQVTASFKAYCLNTTIKFVKNDVKLIMQYPDMVANQADFLMSILLQGKEGNTEETDLGYGYRSMYASLWDAMRVLALEYEFIIQCMELPFKRDMKCVIFEKIPKSNPVVPEKMDVEVSYDRNSSVCSSPTTSPSPPATSSRSRSLEVQKERPTEPRPVVAGNSKGNRKWKKNKHDALIGNIIRDIGSGGLSKEFIHRCMRDMVEYLNSDAETSLEFNNVGYCEEYFIKNLKRLCRAKNAYMLFDSNDQLALGDIKHCLDKHVAYSVTIVATPKMGVFRDVIILKTHKITKNTAEERKLVVQNTLLPGTPSATLTTQENRNLTKCKEINNVERTYVHETLQKISNFLSNPNTISITFEEVTQKQEEFITLVFVWSKIDSIYKMFYSADRILLDDIKLKAELYHLKVVSHDVRHTDEIVSDVTIVKQLSQDSTSSLENFKIDTKRKSKMKDSINLLYETCCKKMNKKDKMTRSPRGVCAHCPQTVQEMLIDGLNQPVQSDKALKMMQNMGWKGGALGLRGDGIIEPIMPLFDRAKGAGLGLGRPPPNSAPPKGKAKKPPPPKGKAKKPASPKGKAKKPPPPKGKAKKPPPPKGKAMELYAATEPSLLLLSKELLEAQAPNLISSVILPPSPGFGNSKQAPMKFAPWKGKAKKPKSTTEPPLRLLSKEFSPWGILPLEAQAPTLIPSEILPPDLSDKDVYVYLNQRSYEYCIVQAIFYLVTKDLRAVHFVHALPSSLFGTNLSSLAQPQVINNFLRESVTRLSMRLPWACPIQTLLPFVAKIQHALKCDPHLQLQGAYGERSAMVYKCRSSDDNKDITTNRNTAETTSQDNRNERQVTDVMDLSGKYVVQVIQSGDGTSKIQSIFSKIGDFVPDENTPVHSIDLTDDEVQNDSKHDAQVENAVEELLNKQTGISNSDKDKRDVNDAENVQIRTVKTTGNDVTKQFNVDNSDKSNAENDQAVRNDNETVNSPQIIVNSNSKKVNNEQTVHNGGTAQKDVVINNHGDKNNAKNYQNGKLAVKISKNDVRKDLITNKSNKTDGNNAQNASNDNDTATCIALAKRKETIPDNNLIETIQTTKTKTNDKTKHDHPIAKSNDKTVKTIDDKSEHTQTNEKNDNPQVKKENDEPIYCDDDDCLAVLNTSGITIEIGSDDEYTLLFSDEETDKAATKATDENVNVEPKTSQELENGKENDIFKKGTDKIHSELHIDEIAVKVENDLHINEAAVGTEKEEGSAALNPESKPKKRASVEFPDVEQTVKKNKLLADFKKLRILHKDYPEIKINKAKAREIQTAILNGIDYKTLPLLNCEGIQNGGLIYSCRDKKSLFFMEDIIKTMANLKIVYEFDVKDKKFHKMAFKIYSFLEEDVGKVFQRLDLFNPGLMATNWELIKKEQYADFVVIYVELNNESFEYVLNANFTLYAGHDCAKFSIVFD